MDIFFNKNFLDKKSEGIPSIFKYLSGFNFIKFIKWFENIPIAEDLIGQNNHIKNSKYNE